MAQHATPTTYTVSLPHSAYRWNLLDSAEQGENNITAVYEHQTTDAWCVISPSRNTNLTSVTLYTTTEQLPPHIETDTECLISLLTNIVKTNTSFMFTGIENGDVCEAYETLDQL